MFFTVYLTTNIINSKFYIGVHKTKNPNDSYFGSGKILKASIQKYGKENFKKEILFCFSECKDAYLKEAELIHNASSNPLCMNISKGGKGGWSWDKNKKQIGVKDQNGKNFRIYTDDPRFLSGELKPQATGFKHSEQAKHNMSLSRKGKKLSESQKQKHRQFRHTDEMKKHLSDVKIGNKSLTGRSWYNDGQNNFCLFADDDNIKFLNKGKISKPRKSGYTLSEIAKINISKSQQNKKWFNDGTKTFFLQSDDQKISQLQLKPGRKINDD